MYNSDDMVPDSQSEPDSPRILQNLQRLCSPSPIIAYQGPALAALQANTDQRKMQRCIADAAADSDETVLSDTAPDNVAGLTSGVTASLSPVENSRGNMSPVEESLAPAMRGRQNRRRKKSPRRRRHYVIASQPTQVNRRAATSDEATEEDEDLDDSKREEEISFRFSQVSGQDFANDIDRKHERAMGLLNRIEAEQAWMKKALLNIGSTSNTELQKQLNDLEQSIELMVAVYRSEKEELSRNSQVGEYDRRQRCLLRDKQILFCRRQKRLDDTARAQQELKRVWKEALERDAVHRTGATSARSVLPPSGMPTAAETLSGSPISQLRRRYGLSPVVPRLWRRPEEPSISLSGGRSQQSYYDSLSKMEPKKNAPILAKLKPACGGGRSGYRASQKKEQSGTQSRPAVPTLPDLESQRSAAPKPRDLCSPFRHLDLQTSSCGNNDFMQIDEEDVANWKYGNIGSPSISFVSQCRTNVEPVVDNDRQGPEMECTAPREHTVSELLQNAELVLISDAEIDTSEHMNSIFQQLGVNNVPNDLLRKLLGCA